MTSSPSFQQLLEQGKAHHHANRLAEADRLYRQALALQPDNPEALYLVGIVAVTLKNYAESLTLLQRAAGLAPAAAHVHHALGVALVEAGKPAEADAPLRRAIVINPANAAHHYDLGVALGAQKKYEDAVAAYECTLRLQPANVFAISNIGTIRAQQFRPDEAIAAFRRAVALQPNAVPLLVNLANTLQVCGRFDEALEVAAQFMAIAPHFLEARFAMAGFLRDSGQIEAALALHDALDAAALDEYEFRQRLSLLHYHPEVSAETILQVHQEWASRLMRTLPTSSTNFPHDRSPDRRLRIGYLSPDLYSHVVARNVLPLFRHHDHDAFEITIYPLSRRDDAMTAEIRGLADHWHPLHDFSSDDAAALIRSHQIDVLVDLALHTKGNGLDIFARKPAPVQFTFAGYPGTTGLSTIDYRLTDRFLDPPPLAGKRLPYAESSLYISSFWCFEETRVDIAVNALPALGDPLFTFGSLNAASKINRTTVVLWSQVLAAVPDSRMIILLNGEKSRARMLAVFAQQGIDAARIRFIERSARVAYLEQFHAIDLCLDTLPYNGHSTSLDALWMGVPTLTLVGKTIVGRAGLSQLSNIDLVELITRTPEEFIAAARRIAGDRPALAALRETLRSRMEASVLMDGRRFAKEIEAAYRTAWGRWCEGALEAGF